MQRRIVVLTALTLAAVSAAGAYGSLASGGPIMGPAFKISRQAFHGYYDGHKDTFLNTDVSNKAEAKAMHINYSPILKTVPLKSAPEMYMVEALENDELVHEAPAIVGRQTPSALAYAGR